MADGKKSFVLYAGYDEVFENLSNEDAGVLIKHIFDYVNDKAPETDNVAVKLSFILIKQQLKRDLEKWKQKTEVRSAAGRVGGLKSGESRSKRLIKKAKTQNASPPKQVVSLIHTQLSKTFYLTYDEYNELVGSSGHTKKEIDDKIAAMENTKGIEKKYKSFKATLVSWLKRDFTVEKEPMVKIKKWGK